MSSDNSTDKGEGFKSISKMMYESNDYLEFFHALEGCGVDLPTSLEDLQEGVFPIYELIHEYNKMPLDHFLMKCIGFYAIKANDYIEDADPRYEEYQKMVAFVRLELDRVWVYEQAFSGMRKSPVKHTKYTVPVRLEFLKTIVERPDYIQQLTEKAKRKLYHIVLNSDERAINGFENSKAFGSKERQYILTPEHEQEVQDILEMLKTL